MKTEAEAEQKQKVEIDGQSTVLEKILYWRIQYCIVLEKKAKIKNADVETQHVQ